MSFTNETTHYGLPQWIGSDKPTYLVDQNNAYQKIDSEIYNANVTAGEAVTTANGAASTAASAAETAAGAVTTAQAAAETANTADGKADSAISQAQAAQTAAGAAQTAAQAAQEAAAGNSITNLAPAYDPTITYAIDALVTAEGKLYKCIVAVDTPEQFDINKWDDVTTSEVYARIGSGGDVYTKTEADALFETQTHASSTYETKANVTAKNNLKLAVNGGGAAIRFGIDGNGNYGYVKDGADTVFPFSSGALTYTFTDVGNKTIGSSISLTANVNDKILLISHEGSGASTINTNNTATLDDAHLASSSNGYTSVRLYTADNTNVSLSISGHDGVFMYYLIH